MSISNKEDNIITLFKKYFKLIAFIAILIAICILIVFYFWEIDLVLTFILRLFISIFYNPIFWVSVFGPFIQSFHFLWLRSKLGIGYKAKKVGELPPELKTEEEEIEELRKALNENKLAYAFSDFNTQLFVTSVAFIFLTVNVFTVISNFYKKSYGVKVENVLLSDSWSLIILIMFIAFFVFGIFVLLSGKLISYKVLQYYKPDGNITGETRFPPIESGLTWFRYLITLYSIAYTWWLNEQVPELIKKMLEN